jgi:hypothetical protein
VGWAIVTFLDVGAALRVKPDTSCRRGVAATRSYSPIL